ncbi:pilus assembly protein TadG-related protein [Promicromonospora sp. MS192]|uniref:pilus assembly protein TadG-related protein n=1 Tax=Promicromonospora sp. MS192 TaxID=3412684 RepID=UPI003C2F66F8
MTPSTDPRPTRPDTARRRAVDQQPEHRGSTRTPPPARDGRHGPGGSESGSVTAWALAGVAIIGLCVGMAVDLGGQAHAHQRAYSLAAQAARTAGQEVSASVVAGHAPVVDPHAAVRAAHTYLATAGVQGTATVTGGTRITVTVHDTWQPRFLGVAGVGPLDVNATATARLIRTVGGTEQ